MIKVPATEAGRAGDRGADRPRRQRQRHAAVLGRALRAGHRRLPRGPRTARERRRPDRRDRLGRLVLRLARRRQGRRPAPAGSTLRGRVAIANARLAYARYRDRFAGARWLALREAGARSQRPLWASTATKDPAYSDVLYVEELIAPDVINTMPEATLRAFADHGDATRRLRPEHGRGRGDAPARRGRRHRPAAVTTRARARRRALLLRLLPRSARLHRDQARAQRRALPRGSRSAADRDEPEMRRRPHGCELP